MQQLPERSGERIYEGLVYSLDTTRREPMFRYDRRVRVERGSLVSTHITKNPEGTVVVTQTAHHDSAYRLTRANMIQRQSGLSGSVEVKDGELSFILIDNGRVTTATEKLTDPVIAGPTTFGFIVTHWDTLLAGASLPVRFAVLERNESIGFILDRVPGNAGGVTVRMRPSSAIIRLAVKPTYFTFDSTSRKVLGYDGRVPPLEEVNGKLKTLDARVRYTFYVPTFR